MSRRLSTRQIWLRGSASAVISALVNVAVAVLAARWVDASPEFLALTPGPVASVSIVVVLLGTAVYWVLDRLTKRPALVFAVIAIVVALASLAAPIALSADTTGRLAGTTQAAALVLIPLHLIPAVVITIAFVWRPQHGTR